MVASSLEKKVRLIRLCQWSVFLQNPVMCCLCKRVYLWNFHVWVLRNFRKEFQCRFLGKVHPKSSCWTTLERPFCPFCISKTVHGKRLLLRTSHTDTAVWHAVLAAQCWGREGWAFWFSPQTLSPLLGTPPPSFLNELVCVPSPVSVCLRTSWGALGPAAVVSPTVTGEVVVMVA